MENNKKDFNIRREKILKGLDLTMQKLIKEKQKNDEEFVFSVNGEIVKVKARDLTI